MSKAEITPGTDDIQQLISELQEVCEADGYDVTIGTTRQGMIVMTGTRDEINNLIHSEGFTDRFGTPTIAT